MPNCVDCGGFVAHSAKTCPRCGSGFPHGLFGRGHRPEEDDLLGRTATAVSELAFMEGALSLVAFGIFAIGLVLISEITGDNPCDAEWYVATVVIASVVLGIFWGQVLRRGLYQRRAAKTAGTVASGILLLVVFVLALVVVKWNQLADALAVALILGVIAAAVVGAALLCGVPALLFKSQKGTRTAYLLYLVGLLMGSLPWSAGSRGWALLMGGIFIVPGLLLHMGTITGDTATSTTAGKRVGGSKVIWSLIVIAALVCGVATVSTCDHRQRPTASARNASEKPEPLHQGPRSRMTVYFPGPVGATALEISNYVIMGTPPGGVPGRVHVYLVRRLYDSAVELTTDYIPKQGGGEINLQIGGVREASGAAVTNVDLIKTEIQ